MSGGTSTAPELDGLPTPNRYWAILTIALGLILAVLNGAIANVALPTIARDLHTDPATSIWVVNSFQLAVTVSLLPLASLGEIHGYRKVYRWGLVVFTIASVFCALSSTKCANACRTARSGHVLTSHRRSWRPRPEARLRPMASGRSAATPCPARPRCGADRSGAGA